LVSLLPFGIFGKPTTLYTLLLLKSSRIDQKLEKATTPKITERYILLANNEPISMPTPTNAAWGELLILKVCLVDKSTVFFLNMQVLWVFACDMRAMP
jgi:hypothetical protein